jgi:hypothetical protein
MTRKDIKKRRFLKSLGRNKVLIIEKNKVKHDLFFFAPHITFYEYWERFKSLFNFNRFEMPRSVDFKGRRCQLSVKRMNEYAD